MDSPALPESLLLVALDDRKGTVHPAAFGAIDHGLRGAVLAELRFRGGARTHGGSIRRQEPSEAERARLRAGGEGEASAVLSACWAAVEHAPSPAPVASWLATLEQGVPFLRRDLGAELGMRGVLAAPDPAQAALPGRGVLPLADVRAEAGVLRVLRDQVRNPGGLDPRLGTLIALVEACGLLDVAFAEAERTSARAIALRVAEKDSIVPAVREAIARSQGTW